MKIVHFAPFAPCACGLYEAARDMLIADRLSGHDVYIVDTGTTINGVYTPGEMGKIDERSGSKVVSASPDVVWDADIIIAHTGLADNWISPCQNPIIWMMHGRPRACFSPEYAGSGHSYTFTANLGRWPRVKKMVTFWPYHMKFWEVIIPTEKLVCLPAPPIDENRFSKDGPKHDYGVMGGKWNIAIAESWREDIDTFEITHGAIELAKRRNDVKFHFYAMEQNLKCWEFLFASLRELGALGEVWARRTDIDHVYRAVDLVLSPQRIVTRSVGEALSCGVPVVAANGCEYATYNAVIDEPNSIANALETALEDLFHNRDNVIQKVELAASNFKLSNYSMTMEGIYKEVLNV